MLYKCVLLNSYAKVNQLITTLKLLEPQAVPSNTKTESLLVFNNSAVLVISNCQRPLFLLSQHHPTEQMGLPLCALSQVHSVPKPKDTCCLKPKLPNPNKSFKVYNILLAFWMVLFLQMAL